MDHQTAVFTVSGRVQGVGFRQAPAAKASELGLSGWVRNRSDGRVEGVTSGDAAALTGFQQWLRQGPTLARVTELQWELRPATEAALPGSNFEVRR